MITSSFPITGGNLETAGSASRALKEQLKRIGVDGQIMRRIMIAAYEAEMNVVIHACKGNLSVRLDHDRFNMEVIDEGPGIADLALAMKKGYSTASPEARQLGFGAGLGLLNIKKASDVFAINSREGKGTRVRSTIYLKTQSVEGVAGCCLAVKAELCNGCLDCLKACPTRALRVWDKKPRILEALCIECTACIAICKRTVFVIRDSYQKEEAGRSTVESVHDTLIIPRAFLTQFGHRIAPRSVMAALRNLGYQDIRFSEEWEEALRLTVRRYAAEQSVRPVISPICPAVVNLIESQFPSLIEQMAPFLTPIESAVEAYSLQTATFVAACPSQHTLLARSDLSSRLRVLSPAELTARVLPLISGQSETARKEQKPPPRSPEPDTEELQILQAWGMETVIDILEKAERGPVGDFHVLELGGCINGCYGTPLFRENPFIARSRWLASRLGGRMNVSAAAQKSSYLARPGMRLDEDMGEAIKKLARINELTASLPGRDCGACGAPTCSSMAEDIVMGRQPGSRCVVLKGRQGP
jgi:anti-sigma regulatory factor (Ser/Thr protein kinase)